MASIPTYKRLLGESREKLQARLQQLTDVEGSSIKGSKKRKELIRALRKQLLCRQATAPPLPVTLPLPSKTSPWHS